MLALFILMFGTMVLAFGSVIAMVIGDIRVAKIIRKYYQRGLDKQDAERKTKESSIQYKRSAKDKEKSFTTHTKPENR